MAHKLTKQMLIDYGVTHVEVVGHHVFVKIYDRLVKPTKDDKIAVSDKTKPYKVYKCGERAFRTQIPLGRVAYAWKNGSIEANEVAQYDPKQNRYVAVKCSDFRKQVLLQWANKQKGENEK